MFSHDILSKVTVIEKNHLELYLFIRNQKVDHTVVKEIIEICFLNLFKSIWQIMTHTTS